MYIFKLVQGNEHSTTVFRAHAKLSQSVFVLNNEIKNLLTLTYRSACLQRYT